MFLGTEVMKTSKFMSLKPTMKAYLHINTNLGARSKAITF